MEENIKAATEVASKIDHTMLKPDMTLEDVKQLVQEAADNGFATVCVPPLFVQDAYKLTKGTGVKVATVIGFPMGYSVTSAKVEEVKTAIDHGAKELDVVMNIAAFKSKRWSYIKNDIQSVTLAAHLQDRKVKIIIETGLLSQEEIIKACSICAEVGVDYVKTSTGFNGEGASVEIVKLMRANLPDNIKIKASGGIKTKAFAEELIEAGADRLGSSASLNLI